jgi:putative heme iron utilization protein
MNPEWASDADAVRFSAPNGGNCYIHRLAFRVLLGREPQKQDCLDFVRNNVPAITCAVDARLRTAKIEQGTNFHLNSRHLRRAAIWQVTCMLKVCGI